MVAAYTLAENGGERLDDAAEVIANVLRDLHSQGSITPAKNFKGLKGDDLIKAIEEAVRPAVEREKKLLAIKRLKNAGKLKLKGFGELAKGAFCDAIGVFAGTLASTKLMPLDAEKVVVDVHEGLNTLAVDVHGREAVVRIWGSVPAASGSGEGEVIEPVGEAEVPSL